MDNMREEFEAWAISDMGYMVARAGDGYKCDYMNTAWLSWEASRSALNAELDVIDARIKREREKVDHLKAACEKMMDSMNSIKIGRH